MQTWQVGDVSIARIVETEGTIMSAAVLLPEATPENVLPIAWLQPNFIDAQGQLITSIHALLVRSQSQRIVIDTCLGNDKPRAVPQWNQRQGSFLADIAAAGFPREAVDFVVCTHLHPDHIGWNTMLVSGRWLPTFPNARYLFAAREWEHLERQPPSGIGDYAGDSVRPVIEAGLADLVEPGFRLTDEVWLESTPGHSPGHVSVRIASRGAHAVVTGDLMHHPCQIARPHWSSPFDFDREQALDTRRSFISRYGDAPVLVIGTHFAAPTAGYIIAGDEGWWLQT